MLNDNYFSGRGEILIGKRDANGAVGPQFLLGEAPTFEVALSVETRKHKESRSGNDLIDKIQATTKGGELRMTLEDIRKDNLALLLQGKKVTIAASNFSGSNYDTFASGAVVGSFFRTKHPNPTTLVIKDSAGTPATLVLNTDYKITDAKHGIIEILNLGSYVQPFRAQYAWAQYDVITAFEGSFDDEYFVYFAGINVESTSDQRIGAEIFRVVFSPTDLLALKNTEQAQFALKAEILRDSTRASDSNYGGFIRFTYVEANT